MQFTELTTKNIFSARGLQLFSMPRKLKPLDTPGTRPPFSDAVVKILKLP